MRKSNKLLIIITIILVLVLVGVVFAYLFLATDIFKSNKELFGKYLTQEMNKIEEVLNFDTIKTYQNLENETKYESNVNVKLLHSEGGEVSNPLNNLSMKLDFQRDDEQQYFSGNGKISYLNETYFATELIKDQEQYGIRFPDVFKQFVTINQDEDIQSVADILGIDVNILETIIQIMDGTEEIVSEEKIKASKDKYLNIITTEILNGTFEKQKDAMITYNNVTTKTTAYSVSLTSEQVRKIITEITEKTNEEIEVPAVKIIIYAANKQAIRTVIDIDENKITIENSPREGENKIIIGYSNLSGEETIECNFEIIKANTENQENFEIHGNVLEGEENYEIVLLTKMQTSNDTIDFDVEMSHKQDITTVSLILENTVNIGKEIKNTQTLTENNFKSLSSIKDETKRKQIIDSIKQLVIQDTTGKVFGLMGKIMVEEEEVGDESENQEFTQEIPQTQINNFNAKFEFYAGEEVSAENVKILLNIIKENCSGHAIANTNLTESTENEKGAITLYIQEGTTNDESMQKALELIDESQKYKVIINYKETNGLIDYITITEM